MRIEYRAAQTRGEKQDPARSRPVHLRSKAEPLPAMGGDTAIVQRRVFPHCPDSHQWDVLLFLVFKKPVQPTVTPGRLPMRCHPAQRPELQSLPTRQPQNQAERCEDEEEKEQERGSTKWVKRPGNAGTGGKNQNDSQQQQYDDQGNQPPFFLPPGEPQKFFEQRPHGIRNLNMGFRPAMPNPGLARPGSGFLPSHGFLRQEFPRPSAPQIFDHRLGS